MFELAQSDYDILHSIENIVDGIAAMYGEHTEVLLHSLDVRNPSIIKIANSHVTGLDIISYNALVVGFITAHRH